MVRTATPPQMRQRTIRGKSVAYLTLTDHTTGYRKDHWLGAWNSAEALQKYARLIAEWGAAGMRVFKPEVQLTVQGLVDQYQSMGLDTISANEAGCRRDALKVLTSLYGDLPAGEFEPRHLRTVQQEMIGLEWTRGYVNSQVRRVRAAFAWGVVHCGVPANVVGALRELPPVKRGACAEGEKVEPVAMELVTPIEPFVSKQVWAMIQLQLLTGARPGELVEMTKGDIERNGATWTVTLSEHKTAHHGKQRALYFGPKAQEVLAPFLMRPDDAYLFSPAEAERERRAAAHAKRLESGTPLSCGNRPGTNKSDNPKRPARDHYDVASYRRAIQRGCDLAFPVPAQLNDEAAEAWRDEHRWHPHQLRHTAATEIRKQFGLEAAALVLGHSSAKITDAIYAERDKLKVAGVIEKIG